MHLETCISTHRTSPAASQATSSPPTFMSFTRPSFITQSNHRIDSRGTAGGEVAREQRHDPEYRRHTNVRQRVIRAHAGNEIAHEARDGQRRGQFEKQKPVEGVEAFQHSVDIEDRHGWSKGSDLRANRSGHRFGGERGAHLYYGERAVFLRKGLIEIFADWTDQAESAAVLHHANDAKRMNMITSNAEFMANSALVGPEFASHCFVH